MNARLREAVRKYRNLGRYSPEGIIEMLDTEFGDDLRELVLDDFDWRHYLRDEVVKVLATERKLSDAGIRYSPLPVEPPEVAKERENGRMESARRWRERQEMLRGERAERKKRYAKWRREAEQIRPQRAAALGLPETATWMDIYHEEFNRAIESFKQETINEFLNNLLVPQAIPGGSWKRRHDMTADDCLAVAADYQKRATTEAGMAQVFFQFADAIEAQGVSILGEVDKTALGAVVA